MLQSVAKSQEERHFHMIFQLVACPDASPPFGAWLSPSITVSECTHTGCNLLKNLSMMSFAVCGIHNDLL